MELITEKDHICFRNDEGDCIAEVRFPEEEPGVFSITYTFVDESLRGQGFAGKLMQAVLQEAQVQGKKIKPVCSYAVAWFERNTQYRALLA